MATLKMPLFINGNFNREGKKIRAVPVKTLASSGLDLWRKDGKPDNNYFHADNDRYYLYVEVGGYLAPIGMTECDLIRRAGKEPAMQELFGSEKARIDAFRAAYEQDDDRAAYYALVEKEEQAIARIGSEETRQSAIVCAFVNREIELFNAAKQNDGETFPSFIGAAAVGDLETCKVLAQHRRARLEQQHQQHVRQVAQQEQQEDEKAIQAALASIRSGENVQNDLLNSGRLLSMLFDRYHVQLPAAVRGYVNGKVASVRFLQNGQISYSFRRTSKTQKGSQALFGYLAQLKAAIGA